MSHLIYGLYPINLDFTNSNICVSICHSLIIAMPPKISKRSNSSSWRQTDPSCQVKVNFQEAVLSRGSIKEYAKASKPSPEWWWVHKWWWVNKRMPNSSNSRVRHRRSSCLRSWVNSSRKKPICRATIKAVVTHNKTNKSQSTLQALAIHRHCSRCSNTTPSTSAPSLPKQELLNLARRTIQASTLLISL